MTKTIHHRNLLRNFRNLKPLVLPSFPNLIYLRVDFSENLAVPVQQEPQTLHWYKEQQTIHNIVLKGKEGKSYHPHFSDDLTHDQEFVFVSWREVLDNVDFESENDSMLVLESDNCSNQYKSAESFYRLQQLSDLYSIPICCIYGVAAHGKNEVDSVGGVVKIAIRNEVARGGHFEDAGECVSFLNKTFASSFDPVYKVREIHSATLQIARRGNRQMVFPKIDGSSSFQVLIFTPNSNTFRASPYLCSCECCIKQNGSRPLFEEYELTSMTLIKHAMRSENQQSFSTRIKIK